MFFEYFLHSNLILPVRCSESKLAISKNDYETKNISSQKHKRSTMQSYNASSGSQLSSRYLAPKKNRRRRSEESSLCYKLVSDSTVNGYSGNPIAIYRNEIEIGIALDDKAISQRTCFTDISSSDKLKFKSPGSNGVYIKVEFRFYPEKD